MTTSDVLKSHNIKPSLIRLKVYDFLRNTVSHPTADDIYDVLSLQIPTLSKTSVYNTVKLLADAGLLKVITIDSAQIRYDADISVHGHFMCRICKKVYDFRLDGGVPSMPDGFVTETKEVYYSGICRLCNKK